MKELDLTKETMTSIQLFEMLDNYKELKSLHQAIKRMFEGTEIVGNKVLPTFRENGQIEFYTLNELATKMFVASKDINYLAKITQYWIDKTDKVIEAKFLYQEIMSRMVERQASKDEYHKLVDEIEKKYVTDTKDVIQRERALAMGYINVAVGLKFRGNNRDDMPYGVNAMLAEAQNFYRVLLVAKMSEYEIIQRLETFYLDDLFPRYEQTLLDKLYNG